MPRYISCRGVGPSNGAGCAYKVGCGSFALKLKITAEVVVDC